MKRIDLLNASKLLAKEGFTKPGEPDNTTALMLGVTYLGERRDGATEDSFKDWLEGEVEDDEVADVAGSTDDGEDPTETP